MPDIDWAKVIHWAITIANVALCVFAPHVAR